MDFERFIQDIKENKWNVFGVELYEKGKLSHSYGDTDTSLHEIYSATKTILSIVVGIAWDQGFFDFKRSLLDYLPKNCVSKMPAEQYAAFQQITIENLLTMSVAGLPFRASGPSWLDFSLSCKIKNPGERVFNYSNISAYLVGVALSEALKSSGWQADSVAASGPQAAEALKQSEHGDLWSFIQEKLFAPLGITRYEYQRCPQGYFYGTSGMKLTVHDLSKLGILLYNKGEFEGRRIVSEEYVKRATSIQQMNREGGYGYFIWKYRDGFSINGKWGQKCYVLPEQELIISFLSHIEDESVLLRESMEQHLLEL